MGWVEDAGYELLLEAIQAFDADVILVMGQVSHLVRFGLQPCGFRASFDPSRPDVLMSLCAHECLRP
jgi:hypothetical protein